MNWLVQMSFGTSNFATMLVDPHLMHEVAAEPGVWRVGGPGAAEQAQLGRDPRRVLRGRAGDRRNGDHGGTHQGTEGR